MGTITEDRMAPSRFGPALRRRLAQIFGAVLTILASWQAYIGVTEGLIPSYFIATGLAALAALLLPPRLALVASLLVAGAAMLAGVVRAGSLALSGSEWLGIVLCLGGTTAAGIALSRAARHRWWLAALLFVPLTFAISLGVAGPRNLLAPVVTRSAYVTMPDGVRIALDYHLPRGLDQGARLPAILNFTRYYRAAQLRFPMNVYVSRVGGNHARFAAAGYANIWIDVRGSGASFGKRMREFSREEVADFPHVVDWVIAQPWSSGVVGAEGVSYGGTTAELLMLQRHPAVKAVAIYHSLYDSYTDAAFPGGLENLNITRIWRTMIAALDANQAPEGTSWLTRMAWGGVKPVEGKEALLAAALAEHRRSNTLAARPRETFRDTRVDGIAQFDAMPSDQADSARRARTPTLVISGWLDGGYQSAAIKRIANTAHRDLFTIIGPWDHGPFTVIEPCSNDPEARRRTRQDFSIAFYDRYLKRENNGVDRLPRIRYYTMCGGGWRAASRWPPATANRIFHLSQGRLANVQPARAGATSYRVDESATTGGGSRWASLYQNLDAPHSTGYGDRSAEDRKLLTFDSAPLANDLVIAGNPLARLTLASTQADGTVVVYLEDVAPDGRVTYVTESPLRLSHRALAVPPLYRDFGPVRSHRRADARPMVAGQAETIEFGLLPVAYRFARGHRVRLAIAGADAGNLRRVPGPTPIYTLRWGKDAPAMLSLPIEDPRLARRLERLTNDTEE